MEEAGMMDGDQGWLKTLVDNARSEVYEGSGSAGFSGG